MKTIELSEHLPSLDEMLTMAGHDNLLLKTQDGREFIMAEVDNFDREIELTRQNQKLMDFLDERSRESKTWTLDEVKEKLDLE